MCMNVYVVCMYVAESQRSFNYFKLEKCTLHVSDI